MTERPKLTLERTFQASIDEVWELWTTKEGIESWWGPEGFSVVVRDLDLRPGHGLAYMEKVDFIPGVETYEVETVIELAQVGGEVRMVLTFDAMHDDHWTKLAVMGREGELVRLAKVLAARQ